MNHRYAYKYVMQMSLLFRAIVNVLYTLSTCPQGMTNSITTNVHCPGDMSVPSS